LFEAPICSVVFGGLQGALEEKEQQLMELQARSKVSALKEHYDRVLNEANSERETLSKEKSSLMAKLQSLQASNAENRKRLEQKYRGHIRELETKMKAASRRAAEATRYERLKSRMDDHCQRLQDEITRMKQQKVALAKAVEQSNKEMNQYKRKRDKELAQVCEGKESRPCFSSYCLADTSSCALPRTCQLQVTYQYKALFVRRPRR
jgi:DNA repair exonuclease SbcCD ATPase subunit